MSRHRKNRRGRVPPSGDPGSSASVPCLVYQCVANAFALQEGTAFLLGTYQATTPRLAIRWLRARAAQVIDQLDPPAAEPTYYWLADERYHEHALSALAEGQPFAYTIFDDGVRYVLSAQPAETSAL